MKEIVVDIGDISLHKEVYDTKPHRLFAWFIYGLFALVSVAGVWAYFGQIDLVVRANGVIRPYGQTATIVNATSGEVTYVNFYNGMSVTQGQVLYRMDTFAQENQARLLQEQRSALLFRQESLQLFIDSIEQSTNLVGGFNWEYSARVDRLLLTNEATVHASQAQSNVWDGQLLELQQQAQRTRQELELLQLLERSIVLGENLFADAQGTPSAGSVAFQTFANQFASYALEIDSLDFQLDNLRQTVYGLETIRSSVVAGYSLFATPSTYGVRELELPNNQDRVQVYASRVEEFLMSQQQLQEAYDQASQLHANNLILFAAGGVAQVERNRTEAELQQAQFNLQDFNQRFLLQLDNQLREANNQLTLIANQRSAFHANTLAGVSTQILSLENSVANLNQQMAQNQLLQASAFFHEGQLGDVSLQQLGEVNQALNQLSAIQQELISLETQLDTLHSQIELATVVAHIDGELNTYVDLLVGDFLPSGLQVLSIIPNREDYLNTHIFVSNQDIGRLAVGMDVRYLIPAMPRQDFGEIVGTITRISPDMIVDAGAAGYFLVEAQLADRMFYDTTGQGTHLRVGMGFDARMVVDRQSILVFLLEQVNLWFR